MKVQIINKHEALKEAMNIKEKAFAIANSYNTLPGYCREPECVRYCELCALTQLKEGEGAIFINDKAACWLTDFEISEGSAFIGKICVKNAKYAEIIDNNLIIHYNDGIAEYFTYDEEIECFRFEKNSLGTKMKPDNGILN